MFTRNTLSNARFCRPSEWAYAVLAELFNASRFLPDESDTRWRMIRVFGAARKTNQAAHGFIAGHGAYKPTSYSDASKRMDEKLSQSLQ